MSVLKELNGIKKPDEKSEIEFGNDPAKNIRAGFDAWFASINPAIDDKDNYYLKDELPKAEMFYDEAYKIVNKKMQGLNPEKFWELFKNLTKEQRVFFGIYLSVLMNKSCFDEINIVSENRLRNFIGYKLARGKIVIDGYHSYDIGTCATGGYIINNCYTEQVGYDAGGDVLILNNKTSTSMATKASGGI